MSEHKGTQAGREGPKQGPYQALASRLVLYPLLLRTEGAVKSLGQLALETPRPGIRKDQDAGEL